VAVALSLPRRRTASPPLGVSRPLFLDPSPDFPLFGNAHLHIEDSTPCPTPLELLKDASFSATQTETESARARKEEDEQNQSIDAFSSRPPVFL
jgi:hypothetical protein